MYIVVRVVATRVLLSWTRDVEVSDVSREIDDSNSTALPILYFDMLLNMELR